MKLFSPFPSLHIAYSSRTDGSFRDQKSVIDFLASTTTAPLSYLKLEHSNTIAVIEKQDNDIHQGDAIVSNVDDQILSFVVGDCYPVIIFDAKHHAVALLHCGWKSLIQNLIALCLEQMHNTYQTHTKDVQVWIGPGICSKHYTQAEQPAQLGLTNWESSISINEYKMYSIDLNSFIHEELIRLGVSLVHISDEQKCTYEEKNDLFSHRRSMKKNEDDCRFFVATWITE